ncbi:hypothetical protein BDQ94DRAFT_53679 [Aspergillus welwitschiae]|uniref:Uncharacterized protein n=1 Tax=Aspergillus welwitschiae TaxID=1341132 RepID=A0A3F3PYC0_9EURO|nr:hypothetical protein BDQ94DRAFT_53679 [Aspergillus welwitschiae]RDH31960.1 hypothetical protein BDQ94DRAFT_53679 [Aspergillus welwitschiae]
MIGSVVKKNQKCVSYVVLSGGETAMPLGFRFFLGGRRDSASAPLVSLMLCVLVATMLYGVFFRA